MAKCLFSEKLPMWNLGRKSMDIPALFLGNSKVRLFQGIQKQKDRFSRSI